MVRRRTYHAASPSANGCSTSSGRGERVTAVRLALRMAPALSEARRRRAFVWLGVAGCVAAALAAGAAAALGGRWLLLVGGGAALTLFLAPTAFADRKPLSGYLAIEGP